jgi:hypothetical protein
MAGIRIEGDTSGNVAEVDPNKLLRTTGAPSGAFDAASAGKFMAVDDQGEPLVFDYEGRLDTSRDSLVFYDPVDGAQTTPDFRLWTWTGTTMTVTQATGPSRITLNGGAITTINTNITLQSLNQFVTFHEASIYFHARVNPVALPANNAQAELGIGTAAGAAAPSDGAYFRWKSNNTFVCVINRAGTEVESAAQTAPVAGEYSHMEIIYNTERAIFMWESPSGTDLRYEVRTPVAASSMTDTLRQPILGRIVIGAIAPGAAPQIHVGEVAVYQKLLDFNELWSYNQVTNQGRGSFQSSITPFAQTANHANSTSPTSATLSNTAAGYTTLGGRFQFAAPAGAATDFALFGFQVPAGYKLCITGIAISITNTGAAVATTATIMDWSVAVNSSAVSLATADSVTGTSVASVGPRRLPLGMNSFLVGAAIGQPAEDVVRTFEPPLVCEPGRFVHIILQVPVGTATASQVIRGDAMVHGYFE